MSGAAGGTAPWVLGADSGGSGIRAALAPAGALGTAVSGSCREPVRTGPGGIDSGHLLELLAPMAHDLRERSGGPALSAAVVGAAGMATLGGRLRAELPGALEREFGLRRLALAADAVTAYAGALGLRPGAVVAAGTGLIGLGTDLRTWRRADGWGHLLGDCGGGAWIGRAGLEAALRAHDGRRGGSGPLLERLEAVLGPPGGLPSLLYPRPDRPALLASFAPEVARCASAGDTVAAGILRRAAEHLADTAEAVCPPPAGPGGSEVPLAFTGGLVRTGAPLLEPLHAELARRLPHARVVPAAGDPLAGALLLAEALAVGGPLLPQAAGLLEVCADGSARNRTSSNG
ncbi:BadF/BadG/BcrA/BcrD ATPase family protein [Streptomyces sp. NPDC006984]|uniref:N-acetylglucosamine kinase n=1 Tax=Streptomyces sp. NPDC006984 TaxID=3155463 RepID=UPI0033FD1AFC